jgi:hypothetical protein
MPPATGAVVDQKSQSSSSVASALPITYDEPDPEKKSWFVTDACRCFMPLISRGGNVGKRWGKSGSVWAECGHQEG